MKYLPILFYFIMFYTINSAFGQKISETSFAIGINKTSSPVQHNYWNENPPPTYLTFNATKSWYNNDHWFSIRKEVGLNLQYSNIDLDSGGLGAHSSYSGNILSLFADAALLAQLRINSRLALAIGPEVEYLLIGNNNLNISYSTMFTNPPSSGEIRKNGINRDYFNQPAYGIKFRLFESGINGKTTIGLNFSYLWTKSEYSNFYAANYARISFFIGFRKEKKELPVKE